MSAAIAAPRPSGWLLTGIIISGIGVPVLGTLALRDVPGRWVSLPIHSTLEVLGAALGLVLVAIILFPNADRVSSARLWMAQALASMVVLDIFHSCVPAGVSFVWLHSLAVLTGGIFFSMAWLGDGQLLVRNAALITAAVVGVCSLIGFFSALRPASLPPMIIDGAFTPAADAMNFIGGGLTLLAALRFALSYRATGARHDLLVLLLCLLFGSAGVIFNLSDAWEAAWWFWHVLRLGGYGFAFWLAMQAYYQSTRADLRRANDELVRSNTRLEGEAEERARAERALARRGQVVEAINEVLHQAATRQTEEEVARVALTEAQRPPAACSAGSASSTRLA